MNVGGTFVCSELGQGTTGCSGEGCLGMRYVELYGVCNCVLILIAEVCASCLFSFVRNLWFWNMC